MAGPIPKYLFLRQVRKAEEDHSLFYAVPLKMRYGTLSVTGWYQNVFFLYIIILPSS